MKLAEKFDIAIKSKLLYSTDLYSSLSHGEQTPYMTSAEWDEFVKGMVLRKKEGFHYKKKLPTTIGKPTILDGFSDDDFHYIFVQATCREPYTSKRSTAPKSYEKLFGYINEQMTGSLQIDFKLSKCGRYFNVDYFAEGEKILHFDLGQMICHLLGIASGVLGGSLERKQSDFIYLLYDPDELELDDSAKEAITAIYERYCYECNLVDFAGLLRVIFEFLNEEYYENAMSYDEIYDMIFKFTFTLASQEFYPILIQ